MSTNAEVAKLTGYAVTGPAEDAAVVSKLVAFVILVPGDGGADTSTRQGFCYGQQVGRT